MADKARKWTDKKLTKMERKLTQIYTQAEKEIQADWNAYMKRLHKRLSKKQAALDKAIKSGDKAAIKAAREDLQKSIRWGTLINKKYKAMVDKTAENLTNVNKIALAYVNGEVPEIIATNFNGISEDIKKVVKVYDWTAVDAETVRQVTVLDRTLMLPLKKINVTKDKRWNVRKINSAILQGILQGDSIPKLATRIQSVTDSNRKAAIRNARTMVTAAENRGRLAGQERAEEEGIILQKTWLATPDSRTRESHLALDGVTIDTKDTFPNGLLYPGDYGGKPAEVYNCRCSLTTRVIGFRKPNGRIDYINYDRSKDGESLHERQMREERAKRG